MDQEYCKFGGAFPFVLAPVVWEPSQGILDLNGVYHFCDYYSKAQNEIFSTFVLSCIQLFERQSIKTSYNPQGLHVWSLVWNMNNVLICISFHPLELVLVVRTEASITQ